VQLLGKGIVGVDANGKFLWRYNRVANGTANISTPIVRGEHVFCSTGYGTGAALLKLSKDSAGGVKADEVYFLPANSFQNHHGGMILVGEHVYAGTGHNAGSPACVEFMTGKLAWPNERGPGTGSAAICYADGHLYFRYQNGVMALIEANPKEYKLKGTFKIPEQQRPSWPHPVVVDGKLYLREQGTLLCYDVKK
jgi:outer membrane protein assembly factor BamB